ncbi:MAG TPA: peptidyl-prolyl cis-trans isomerase, partial [bacterium]|nr:peptidyl-prolyl cis-trans isomerase [bacterium]
FGNLVHKYSDSESASRGGRIGPVSQGSMDPVIEREIFSLEPGQVSSCIETYSGFHLFIVDNRTSALSPQWDQIKDRVISQIEEEHYGELVQKTKEETLKTADVTNNLDKLVVMNKPSDLLFRVGETRFTVDDYLYLYPHSRPEIGSGATGVERFDKNVLREVFERALLAEAARRRGYLDVSEIRKQLERKSRQLLIDLQLQSLCSEHFKDIVSDEAQLRAFYDSEKETFRTDLRVIVDRVTLGPATAQGEESTQAQQLARKRLNKQVTEVFELLRNGSSASELSKHGVQQWRSSESPQEITHFEQELQESLRTKAHQLLDSPPVKDVLPDPRVIEPVKVEDKFVILRIREVFPSRLKAFEEVRHEIEGRLLETKQQDVALQQAGEILMAIQFQLTRR